MSDKFGDHAVSCGYQGERISRHNLIRDLLFSSAATANLSPLKEVQALIPGTEARPADLYLRNWTSGKDTCLDITIVNALRTDLVSRAATEPGHALTTAYAKKWKSYGEQCENEGLTFIPLPMDTLGALHTSTIAQIDKLARAVARANGSEEEECVRHLFQRTSIQLTRSNVTMILNRNPTHADPIIDGIL